MLFNKQITWQGHRWNEILQDYDLSDSSGQRYMILKRPISESVIRRGKPFVSAISVKLTNLLADPKLSDEVIRFASQCIIHRLRNQAYVSTDDLKALYAVTINSTVLAELDARGQCDYCASSDSGHNVHCRNFMSEAYA